MFAVSFSRDAAAERSDAADRLMTAAMMQATKSASSTTVSGMGGLALTAFQSGSLVIQWEYMIPSRTKARTARPRLGAEFRQSSTSGGRRLSWTPRFSQLFTQLVQRR